MVCNSKKAEEDSMKDPVCGMEVNEKNDSMEFNGKKYHFCCATCKWAFEKNPEQFTQS